MQIIRHKNAIKYIKKKTCTITEIRNYYKYYINRLNLSIKSQSLVGVTINMYEPNNRASQHMKQN